MSHTPHNSGSPETKWRALDIDCPVCKADKEQACHDESGAYRAPHIERARVNRWSQMGVLG